MRTLPIFADKYRGCEYKYNLVVHFASVSYNFLKYIVPRILTRVCYGKKAHKLFNEYKRDDFNSRNKAISKLRCFVDEHILQSDV